MLTTERRATDRRAANPRPGTLAPRWFAPNHRFSRLRLGFLIAGVVHLVGCGTPLSLPTEPAAPGSEHSRRDRPSEAAARGNPVEAGQRSGGSADAQRSDRPNQPEAAVALRVQRLQTARKQMVATANPLASQTAQAILRAGGNAADAAIAAQWVLGLVEPQSSGLGGGTMLLYHDAASQRTVAIDGRETAPALAEEQLFLGANGRPIPFAQAVVGGRSVGVPGTVAALSQLHAQYGRLPWPRLFDEAIKLAEQGFAVSPRLHGLLKAESHLKRDRVARAYFYDERGEPWPVGHRLRNLAMAKTLRNLASDGAAAFYQGELAQAIVEKVSEHSENPGRLSLSDMAGYRARLRDPVCGPYLRYWVCGMPPPSSGGVAVLQMLSIMQSLSQRGAISLRRDQNLQAGAVHRFTEAARLAYADRGRFLADPEFVDWPRGMLAAGYLNRRAALVEDSRSMRQAEPGNPADPSIASQAQPAPFEYEENGTSHWSIADSAGNVIAITSTIEDAFGARQMVGGFLLNNQLTDFSFLPADNGQPIANRVEPGKRPRSSMAPTLVFERRVSVSKDGQAGVTKDGHRDGYKDGHAGGSAGPWLMSIGSPGGSNIINYVAKVLVAVLADSMDIQSAISLPNFGSRNGPTELEAGRTSAGLQNELRALGHELRLLDLTSGLQGIVRHCRGKDSACPLSGGADPRREGLVLGD